MLTIDYMISINRTLYLFSDCYVIILMCFSKTVQMVQMMRCLRLVLVYLRAGRPWVEISSGLYSVRVLFGSKLWLLSISDNTHFFLKIGD